MIDFFPADFINFSDVDIIGTIFMKISPSLVSHSQCFIARVLDIPRVRKFHYDASHWRGGGDGWCLAVR